MKRSLLLLSLLSLYKTVKGGTPQGAPPTTTTTESTPPPTTTTTTESTPPPTYTPSLFTVLTHGLETATTTTSKVSAKELERIEILKHKNEQKRIKRLNEILKIYMPDVGKGQITSTSPSAYQLTEDIRKQRKLIRADKELSGAGAEMEMGEVLAGVVSGLRKQGRSSKQPDLYLKIADADTGETKP